MHGTQPADTTITGYKGVAKRESGRFYAQLWRDGKQEQLGTFDTAVEAAVAYTRAAGQKQPRAPVGGLAEQEPSRAEPAAKRARTSPGSARGLAKEAPKLLALAIVALTAATMSRRRAAGLQHSTIFSTGARVLWRPTRNAAAHKNAALGAPSAVLAKG